MENPPALEIRDGPDFLILRPLAYSYPEAEEYFQANALKTSISLRTGIFHCSYTAETMTCEFTTFMKGLWDIFRGFKTKAVFFSLGGEVMVCIRRSTTGAFTAGIDMDVPVTESIIDFDMSIDRYQVFLLYNSLLEIAQAYPVKKSSGDLY